MDARGTLERIGFGSIVAFVHLINSVGDEGILQLFSFLNVLLELILNFGFGCLGFLMLAILDLLRFDDFLRYLLL